MDFIFNRMWLWFIIAIILMMGIWANHGIKKEESGDKIPSSPSTIALFFDPIKGKGDIFLGGVLILFLISLFFWDLTQFFRNHFGSL